MKKTEEKYLKKKTNSYNISISLPVAKLIIGQLQHTLSKPQRTLLSAWIAMDRSYEYAFDQCLNVWNGPFLDTGQLHDKEEEEIYQLWDIAGLMVRYNKSDILSDEQKKLIDWTK